MCSARSEEVKGNFASGKQTADFSPSFDLREREREKLLSSCVLVVFVVAPFSSLFCARANFRPRSERHHLEGRMKGERGKEEREEACR